MEENEVFKPKNTAELLRWLVFEPQLLEEYSDTIKDWRQRLRAMLMPMFWIAVFNFWVYFFFIAVIAAFDLPVHLPSQFRTAITEAWTPDFWQNAQIFFDFTFREFLIGLALGLA